MKRRNFLQLTGAGLVLWKSAAVGALSTTQKNELLANKKNIVWIILRGAMDSLHTVVPTFDPYLMPLREELVKPIADNLLTLDRGFGLHPDLSFLHQLYKNKQFTPIVAVATPYRERSHFDAQDFLESGMNPVNHDNGWLARAVNEYHSEALALAQSVPITLRGTKDVHSWYPSALPQANEDLYTRLMSLYESDPDLQTRLAQAMDTSSRMGDMSEKRNPRLPELAAACAKLLKEDAKLTCAMMEMGGWDTHNNLVKRLSNQFKELNNGIQVLHDQLGDAWKNTLVIVATEFGRTAKVNGTNGSDHGTASALFLAGGAMASSNLNKGTLKGGRVLGEWPGLAPDQLFQGRDLQPTSNTFDWIKLAMQQHWQLSDVQMARVFPTTKA